MLGYNCDKTVITPPTTTTASNKWTTQIDDNNNKVISMASSGGGGKVMEKPGQELAQQQQVALRCPRCDSSNTKFCYYNNYSLSQPRHFCKACKRYWTRGGTLRNVPVGGGCRKNKRTSVKRPTTTSSSNNIIDTTTTTTSASVGAAASPSSTTPNSQPHIDNHHHPLLFGLPGGGGGGDVMNLLPFPRFNSRVSSSSYDLDQPRLNALGLGFSSGILSSHEVNDDDGYRNGLFSSNNYNTLLSSYGSIFGSSINSTTSSMPSTPVMASLLSSTLLQQKFTSGSNSPFQGMNMNPLLQELKLEGNGSSGGSVAGLVQASKEVMKGEGQNNRLEWNDDNNNNGGVCQNQMERHMGLSDPSSLYWNSNTATATATALGAAWSEQPNIGPNSVTLL